METDFRPDRLLQLAAFLEPLPPEKFDFRRIMTASDGHGCGSVACALGWLPAVFPNLVGWIKIGAPPYFELVIRLHNKGGINPIDIAEELFGITEHEAEVLFVPACCKDGGWRVTDDIKRLPGNATAQAVAQQIRDFVEYKMHPHGEEN